MREPRTPGSEPRGGRRIADGQQPIAAGVCAFSFDRLLRVISVRVTFMPSSMKVT
jgi:hypothetical protein